MTFFITGLICWGYVLLDEIQHAGHMLLITLVPTMAVIFIWIKCGGKPGPRANSVFGQIILAGVFNGIIMLLLGKNGVFIGIPLNSILLVAVAWSRLNRLLSPKRVKT